MGSRKLLVRVAAAYLVIFAAAAVGIALGCSPSVALLPVLGVTAVITAMTATYVGERRRLTYRKVHQTAERCMTQKRLNCVD